MALHAKWDDVKSTGPKKDQYHSDTEMMVTKRVYGNEGSLMVATRPPGYHSFPHTHDCEQLNYCMDGEIWIFVDDEGHRLQKGDFSRVPRGKIHWAWNRSDQPCTLIESHVPQMSFDDPERQAALVGLFAEGEEPQITARVTNIFHDEYGEHRRQVEERHFGSGQ